MTSKKLKNTFWEDAIYSQGHHLNKYPFDNVVTFIFRNFPRTKPKNEVKILEVGSGAGNNLWFAAREGFSVTGIDGSQSAIDFSKKRFDEEKLEGDFVVGNFTKLPFEDNSFDIAIDRCSIVCVNFEDAKKAVDEVHRVLNKEGKFFFNIYSQAHTSFLSGQLQEGGLVKDIQVGLVGAGDLCFYSHTDILNILPKDKWRISSIKHKEIREIEIHQTIHAEWEVVAEKI